MKNIIGLIMLLGIINFNLILVYCLLVKSYSTSLKERTIFMDNMLDKKNYVNISEYYFNVVSEMYDDYVYFNTLNTNNVKNYCLDALEYLSNSMMLTNNNTYIYILATNVQYECDVLEYKSKKKVYNFSIL